MSSWPIHALKITLAKHTGLQQPNMYNVCCIIESTRLCATFVGRLQISTIAKIIRTPNTCHRPPSRLGGCLSRASGRDLRSQMPLGLAEKCLDSLCIGPTVLLQKLLQPISIMLTERQKENCHAFKTYSLRSMA
jgi:hypothetical protein